MKTWFELYLAAWGSGEVDAVMEWMADDIDYEDTTLGEHVRGTAAMRKFVRGSFAAAPGVKFELVRGADLGDDYFIEWIMQPMGVRGVSVGTRSEGRIRLNRDYWDGRRFTIGEGSGT